MKNALVAIAVITMTNSLIAYDFCNKSNTPISVIVCLNQAKAEECLQAMGWNGQFPSPNQTLKPSQGQFNRPEIFAKQHWLIRPEACDGVNWRDLQKDLDDKNLSTLYFMIFESFDKTGSSVMHFLTSGSFNIKNTITLSGSQTTGWHTAEQ